MAGARGGFRELRKLMRRPELRGFSLRAKGGQDAHLLVVDPEGRVVRLPSGQPLVVPSSPRHPEHVTRALLRELQRLGLAPKPAAPSARRPRA